MYAKIGAYLRRGVCGGVSSGVWAKYPCGVSSGVSTGVSSGVTSCEAATSGVRRALVGYLGGRKELGHDDDPPPPQQFIKPGSGERCRGGGVNCFDGNSDQCLSESTRRLSPVDSSPRRLISSMISSSLYLDMRDSVESLDLRLSRELFRERLMVCLMTENHTHTHTHTTYLDVCVCV